MARVQWRTRIVPYLARLYRTADDWFMYSGSDYFNDDNFDTSQNGDAAVVTPVRTKANADEEPEEVVCYPTLMYIYAHGNQMSLDYGIIYERYKGIPMLQICDVKPQYDTEDHVKYSWKLDKVTEEECKLEIDQSDKNEQGKKIVKFGFATNDTDKLQSQVVDGYEVKYMLRTNAIRLRLKLEMVLFQPKLPRREPKPPHPQLEAKLEIEHDQPKPPHPQPEVKLEIEPPLPQPEVKLEIERDGNPYTIYLIGDQPPIKKSKRGRSRHIFKHSIIRNVPRNLNPHMKLAVRLKDNSGKLVFDSHHLIFSYNIPVDQNDSFDIKDGYVKFKVFWGCCFDNGGKGLCTGVCTCKPVEFIGFGSPGEVSCSKDNEEYVASGVSSKSCVACIPVNIFLGIS